MNERHALVVGAIAYLGQELDYAVGDAGRVADALRARGFSVCTVLNPDVVTIDAALAAFKLLAQTAELALIYVAGHAVERHGSGYFLPVDFPFPPTSVSLRCSAISLGAFVDGMEGAKARIIVLDACRNWPHDSNEARRISNDLDLLVVAERDWPNLLLAYATSATTQAGDGVEGVGSAFSKSLCHHLLDHNLTVDECFRRVSQDVNAKRKEQRPWTYSSLARTLSFADLPRFAAIQRYSVPNPESLTGGTWSAAAFSEGGVIIGVGDTMSWRVGVSGFAKGNSRAHDRLVGAADCGTALVLASSDGSLYRAGAGPKPAFELGVEHAFGLEASTTAGGFTHYGADIVTCASINNHAIEVVARHDVGFDVYCCAYMPDGLVWVAGGNGQICELDPLDPNARFREVAVVSHHVNAIAVNTAGNRVFVVGQGGLAVELNRSGAVIAELLPDRQLKTAAGIRDQLLNSADDEHIRAFIFEPSKIGESVRKCLSDLVSSPDYHDCSLAPTLPILAVATQESSVVLVDTRDLQVIQELDVGSGNSSIVAGVHFLSDHELAVVGGRGDVTFFIAGT